MTDQLDEHEAELLKVSIWAIWYISRILNVYIAIVGSPGGSFPSV